MRKLLYGFFVFVQWTYGILQNSMGFILFVYWAGIRKSGVSGYRSAVVTECKRTDGLSLGMFVFTGNSDNRKLVSHEYGHTLESLILGPLYLPIIGLPSLIWAQSKRLGSAWRKGQKDYYAFYPEKWANRLGKSKITTLKAKKEGEAL